jgi:hypothetical protein
MANDEGSHADDPLEQIEFDINDINSEVAQNAVRELQFVSGGAVVTYNPLGITIAPRFGAPVIARLRSRAKQALESTACTFVNNFPADYGHDGPRL